MAVCLSAVVPGRSELFSHTISSTERIHSMTTNTEEAQGKGLLDTLTSKGEELLDEAREHVGDVPGLSRLEGLLGGGDAEAPPEQSAPSEPVPESKEG